MLLIAVNLTKKILYDLQQEELAKKKSVDNQALVTKARDIYTKQYSESGTPEYRAERSYFNR